MTHALKILPQYYHAVREGRKTFEIRVNDRGFNAGDGVILREWVNPSRGTGGKPGTEGKFTESEPLSFRIGYVLPIDAERVVFSLLPLETPCPHSSK